MSVPGPGSLASPAAAVIEAIIFAVFLFQFYRHHRRRYLFLWSASWSAFALFHIAAHSSAWLDAGAIVPHGREISLGVAAAAACFQLLCAIWGCYELTMRRPLKYVISRQAIAITVVAATIFAITLISLPSHQSALIAALAIHALMSGGVFLGCAHAVWKYRGRKEPMGFVFLTAGMAAYGLMQCLYFIPGFQWLITGGPLPWSGLLGSYLLALEGATGFGMFICFLDDERKAALLAASQVEHIAYHDTLTGLPNRDLFFDRLRVALAQANRHGYKVAILFLDLDRFKEINDSLGHGAGDTMLRTAAERIRNCVREGDTVARFGGDEFVILIHIIGRFEDAGRVAQKILDKFKEPFSIAGHEIVVTSSIGITIYPLDGEDAATLVQNADAAMYRAKQSGRDGYQLYTSAMNSRALERLDLENRLRKALQNHELELYYQPLYDAVEHRVFALEALLRWHHPELGMLLPEKFIGTAETSGLIVPIGNWVLREACRQAKEWQNQGLELGVSVNLSPRQFQQNDLARQVLLALHASQLNPRFLELEITEGIALHDFESSMRMLRELKKLGVRIAIDDFGTGYSSLMYLKSFPVDTLKLDRAFVRDISAPHDAAIARGIISIAHNLQMKVVAEGVETQFQWTFLKENRCDSLQGYFFSVPLSAKAFGQFATRNEGLLFGAAKSPARALSAVS
ncbi:MAG: EAL domain-containing protein [Acidobacteriota bacterium]